MLRRTKKGLYALDTFNDNLCVFRFLAVQRGAHKKNNLKKNKMHHIPLIARYFNQAIIVFDVSDEGVWSVYPRRERGKRRTISTNDHCSVLRHTAMCKNGQTKIVCLEEKIWAPEFLYERAFYPRGKYGRPPFIC